MSPIQDYVHLDDQIQPTFEIIIKLITIMMMVMMLFFLNSTLLDVKKEIYVICTLHVSNNGQLNTLITIHKEVERDAPRKEKKKKNVYILCTQTMVQKKVLRSA